MNASLTNISECILLLQDLSAVQAEYNNNTTDDEHGIDEPPDKLVRLGKPIGKSCMRIRYNKYCQSWTEIDEFKGWLTKSSNNKNEHEYAFCKLCHCDITAHKNSITRHSVSEKHIFNKRKISQNKKVTDMAFIAAEDNVKRAEIKLCAFVASNNLPFRMMDTLSPLCANLFPDSKIASKLAVRRTKATSILKNCLGEVFQNKLINTLRIPGTFFFNYYG